MALGRVVVVLLGIGGFAFGGETRGFYVAPNAADVTRAKSKEADSIVYFVKEPFPATNTIASLQDALAKAGWSPVLERKDLNKYERSSLLSGWTEAPTDNGASMRLWSARWRDERGNEVTYTLVYRSPGGRHGLQPTYVGVGGLFFTKKQAAVHKALMDAQSERMSKALLEHRTLRPQ
jgi:hypothetical protein